MPIHDWTRMEAGDFHDFHQAWIIELRTALNRGLLPPGYLALAEQVTGGPVPDVVTPQTSRPTGPKAGGLAVKEQPPTARMSARTEHAIYARRADRVAIRHRRGRVIAIIEIVSAGNKSDRHTIRSRAEKSGDLLRQGINLLVVDLFPPTPCDPQGIHKVIWDEVVDQPFELPLDKPLTVAAYLGGPTPAYYVEPAAVGDPLPPLPIFLSDNEYEYIPAPLEETYSRTWAAYPDYFKEIMDAPPAGPPAGD